MKKVKIKIPAKVNLSLFITGVKDGYHQLSSVVTSINVFNTVKAKVSKTNSVKFKGFSVNGESNAEKALNAFTNATGKTASVKITPKIPVGQGLGSSSADIAGTLKALDKLFVSPCNIEEIANSLGSDTAYMLKGGFAHISGRGEVVTPLKLEKKLYLVVVKDSGKIGAGECYAKYDSQVQSFSEDCSLEHIHSGDINKFLSASKNDLYAPASHINLKVKKNYEILSNYSNAFMTGSGSAVYSVFLDKKQRNVAYRKLKKVFKKNIFKAQTI